MVVTFFGHWDAPRDIQPYLKELMRELIVMEDAYHFVVGNQGAFDETVRLTALQLKQEFPYICCTVMAAYRKDVRDCDETTDGICEIFPEALSGVHPEFVISKRNQLMLYLADTVITYVVREIGGAARFKAIARKMHKRVIDLPEYIKKTTER